MTTGSPSSASAPSAVASGRVASGLAASTIAASAAPASATRGASATHSPMRHDSPLGQRRVSGPVSHASRHDPPRQYEPVGHVTPAQSSVVQYPSGWHV